MNKKNSKLIPIEQIKIGMFVKLDLSWFEHSFQMSSFKIVNEKQLRELRALNLKKIRVIISESDPASLIEPEPEPESRPVAEKSEPQEPPDKESVYVFESIIEAKKERFDKLQTQRAEIARCEEKFVMASAVIKNIDKLIFSQPKETLKEAGKLIDTIAQVFQTGNDALMHLIRYQQEGNEEMYFHALNVSVVAMMLANEMKCNEMQMKRIGLAALFHDLGKVDIPAQILKKTTPLSRPEQNIYQLHPQYGLQIGKNAGLDREVLDVIANHHEYLDGTGFPNKLKDKQISILTRIITIANVYDKLCNHIDPNLSITPHAALALMFTHRRSQFDPAILALLVKCLGIYPPGTLVKLSNDAIGLVINVNTGMSLRPRILLYDEEVPPEQAIILDLATESNDISITESLRPSLLPKTVFDYLSPRKRLSYFVDSKSANSSTGAQSAAN